MEGNRWEQIEHLIDQALDLPPEQRQDFIKDKTGGDYELFKAANRLLDSINEANQTNFLEPGSLQKHRSFLSLKLTNSESVTTLLVLKLENSR